MSTLFVVTLLLAAQPDAQAAHRPLMAPIPLIMPAEPQSPADLRKAHDAAIRRSYQAALADGVPELATLYRQLEQDKLLPAAERAQLRHKARIRLLSLGDKIVGDARRERNRARLQEEAAHRTPYRPLEAPGTVASATPSGRPADYVATAARATSASSLSAAGGLGEDEGEALVELIRNTIAPDSWDTAGGPGSIVYYRQWQALVIRQTQENHWLIGGMREALGKAR